MKNNKKINDPSFYNLANAIANILKKHNNGKKLSKKEFTKQQKYQVEKMQKIENNFKDYINSYKQSDKIYHKFLIFIKIEKGNILTARPFFREKSATFGQKISPAFKEDDTQKLKQFNINYKFMKFIKENWKGNFPARAEKMFKDHGELRQKIIENCMPLAINQAMKFYKSVPKDDSVTLMDMINASMAGLAIGVDKWVGPFRTVFRSVCLGRMKSNIMDLYNQTFLHYYPSDKKIIYKANLIKSKNKIEDNTLLLQALNEYLEESGDNRVLTEFQLESILNGTSYSPIEIPDSDNDNSTGLNVKVNNYDIYIDENSFIEEKVEKIDALKKVIKASSKLNIIEKKVLKLKGIDL